MLVFIVFYKFAYLVPEVRFRSAFFGIEDFIYYREGFLVVRFGFDWFEDDLLHVSSDAAREYCGCGLLNLSLCWSMGQLEALPT